MAKSTSEKAIAKLATPDVQVIFSHLDKTEVIEGKDSHKYSVTVRFENENPEHMAFIETIKGYQEEGKRLMIEKKGDKVAKYDFATWLRADRRKDGDELVDTGDYQITFRCGDKFAPSVFGLNGDNLSGEEVTFGAKVVVEFQVVPYAMAATKKIGVSLRMNNVLLLQKGGGSTQLHSLAAQYRDKYVAETTSSKIEEMEKNLGTKTG